jgi:hypothetical protein
MEGEMLKLGSLGRTLEGSSKKKLERLVVKSASFLSLLIVRCSPRLYWCSWSLLSLALLVLAKFELIFFSLSCLQTCAIAMEGLAMVGLVTCNGGLHSSWYVLHVFVCF